MSASTPTPAEWGNWGSIAAPVFDPSNHDAQVARLLGKGYHIETQTAEVTQLVKGHRVNHILHLLLSLVTFGTWLPVWIVLAIAGGGRRKIVLR